MSRIVRVTSRKTLPTYSRLRGVSWFALRLAEKGETGWMHHCMTAMLFSAFCIEAFLNHLGDQQLPFWEPLKKKLSPYEKLQVLSTIFGFTPDFGVRPYQTFKSIFKLRDLLVHGKTETLTLEGEFILSPGEMPPEPLSEWEQLISLEGARRFVEDTKLIVQDLYSHAGIDKNFAFSDEISDWTAETKYDDDKPSS